MNGVSNGNAGDTIRDLEALKAKLSQYGQNHLLRFWDSLNEESRTELYDDILSIDFEEMCALNRKITSETETKQSELKMIPLEKEFCGSINETSEEKLREYESATFEAVNRGQVGVLLLAGGQGSRLGVPYPKGMFDIGLPSGKTLYQIQVERILRLQELASASSGDHRGGEIIMYVMTSEKTMVPTEQFFEKNRYFGMKKANVVFFEQRMIPCFDFDHKIILETPSKVFRAPDGNGGLYWALKHDGILEHMEQRGVEYLHVYCVDNVLVKVADPVFMGYCISRGAESGNKVCQKTDPFEAVGVVCKVEDKIQVVEYSEVSKETAELRNDDGSLVFNAGNICNHFFTRDFLRKICRDEILSRLPQHIARKKIPFVDQSGEQVIPTKNNGIKMEKFVFDVFQFSENYVQWECLRENDFSPLKNAEGASLQATPFTARRDLSALHKKYIQNSGGKIINEDEEEEEEKVEISPLVSYAGENLESYVNGKQFKTPVLIQ